MLLPRNHHLQMSSCLSGGGVGGGGGGGGGGRAYAALELDILKSPSTSSSPSSTLSDSSNSGLAIATRKPRTPRKRPNQTYNEAAALLSTAYPSLFSPKHLATNSRTFSKSPYLLSDYSTELFFPFRIVDDDSSFLISEKPSGGVRATMETKFSNSSSTTTTTTSSASEKSCLSPGEFDSKAASFCPASMEYEEEEEDDFDYGAGEVDDGGGIDSIMGNLTVDSSDWTAAAENNSNTCYGYPMGLGFELGFGIRRGGMVRALRHVDDGNNTNWWSFPTVDMVELSPRLTKPANSAAEKNNNKKKKMKKVAAVVERENAAAAAAAENVAAATGIFGERKSKSNASGLGLLLKLNYDDVLSAWSDKGSPFSDEADAPVNGNDVAARLAQIDLFPEAGGVREASVLRYKEKRRTRLFSKKIRYQVRKVNADRRPRMKGRFVRRPNSKHE